MREIKFRAWDKEYQIYNNNPHIVIDLKGKVYNQQDGSGGDNYVLEQYIGLKDENGKEIYEGDIVRDHVYKPEEYRVEFVNGRFRLTYLYGNAGFIDIATLCLSADCFVEIIGNIHEGVKDDR